MLEGVVIDDTQLFNDRLQVTDPRQVHTYERGSREDHSLVTRRSPWHE